MEESLRQLHAVADVAVVSAANESAIASEWKRYGLARHADVIFGQEVGSKANSIATMLACGYESRKVMMVGDAMGVAKAAAANGVAFVPILPGREADSWRRLQEEALPKLFDVFYRSDPARKNPAGGSGLGLAIAAKAVQGMGGTIRARSGPHGGLAIEITLSKEEACNAENPDR